MQVQVGDKIYFRRDNYRDAELRYCYRTVRAVMPAGVKIYHLGQMIILPFAEICKITRLAGAERGDTDLSKAMWKKGIRNEDLSGKSGYCLGTVDRARRGLGVKTRTLADIWDTVNGWAR